MDAVINTNAKCDGNNQHTYHIQGEGVPKEEVQYFEDAKSPENTNNGGNHNQKGFVEGLRPEKEDEQNEKKGEDPQIFTVVNNRLIEIMFNEVGRS